MPLETAREARVRTLEARLYSCERRKQEAGWSMIVAASIFLIVFFTDFAGEQRPLILALVASSFILMWVVSVLLGWVVDRARREIHDIAWQEHEWR